MSLQTDIRDNKSSFWSSVALAAAYLVFTLAAIIIMFSGTGNAFVDNGDGTTFVEASWNKIAQDGIPGLFWSAFAVILGSLGQMVYSFWQGFGGLKERDTSFIAVLIGTWLIGWIILFSGTVSRYGDSQYQETIPTVQYEKLKAAGKLDSLFPG